MIIASVGLNMSSTAVIIGAMLISPIMGSILASAYGNVSADYSLLKNHMLGCGLQIAISVAAASIYFFLYYNIFFTFNLILMPDLFNAGDEFHKKNN